MSPIKIEAAVEIPGWGQFPDHVIEDPVSWARQTLESSGCAVALYWRLELERVIAQHTWRSEAAAELLFKIESGYISGFLSDLSISEDNLERREVELVSA